jgi:ParB/RepB/Spo0J family partition protein
MEKDQRSLPLDKIVKPKHPLRPIRRNSPEYHELVESIKKDGVLQPILVRPHELGWEVVEGWHRSEASREAGLTHIPAYIKELTDEEVLFIQIKCNAIRPPTMSFEWAKRLKILMESGHTITQMSALIDKSPTWIRNQLQLNRLAEAVRGPVERGEISLKATLALANLPADMQPKFVDDAIALPGDVFVDRAQEALRDWKAFILNEKKEDLKVGAAKPRLRSPAILKRESFDLNHAKEVLKASNATTAVQGWEACLAWIFRLDPISIKNRQKRQEKTDEGRMSQQEYREAARKMIDKYVKPQSQSGDNRNE